MGYIRGIGSGYRWPHRVIAAGRSVLLASILTTLLLTGMQHLGWLETLELRAYDQMLQRRPDAPPDERLLIVSITEPDLHRYGWPLSDQVLAQGLSQLQNHHPQRIGLDLYRDLPHPPGEAALAEALQASNLVAITNIIGNIPPPPGVPPERVGFNDLPLDSDGILRRSLLFVNAADRTYTSFALQVSLPVLAAEGIDFRVEPQQLQFGSQSIHRLKASDGGYQRVDTGGYQTLLDYRGRHQVAPIVTFSQLLDGNVAPELIRDRIVLIGSTAPSLKDMLYTPYRGDLDTFHMPGVIIHAHIISQLLDIALGQRAEWRFLPRWGEGLWLWGGALLGGALVWQLGHPLGFGLAGLVLLGLINVVSWSFFLQGLWVPGVGPSVGLVGAMGLTMAHRLFYTHTRDPLTGLPNRRAFLSILQRLLTPLPRQRESQSLGVMIIGLDRFNVISQSLGNRDSDRLLRLITARLRGRLPRSTQLARLGQDDFALALRSPDASTLTTLADRLQSALAAPFSLGGHRVYVTASMGIAVAPLDQSPTADTLLRDAQTAMYRAQALGKGRYEVFAKGLREASVDQFMLETDLRQGLANHEFILYYQPIVALSTGQVAGFEALIRWQHPQKGFISPGRFIPLAEETGLILPLGEWICRTACHQAQQWGQQFPTQPPIISINLSSRQFEQPHLATQLGNILQSAGIPGSALKLEITESMVMGDVNTAIDLMLRLKALGCKLGLDDFGTGYSSLSYLRRFPIDTLKVDQSFVNAMGDSHEDHEIVRTIIGLSHTLGMDVIAEGVETAVQADALRSLDCDFGQGYFWAKPLPAAEATALLLQSRSGE